MKNQKTILLLLVVTSVLTLAVVYAALTTNFTISTNATVAPDASNFNVAFTTGTVTKVYTLGADATTANKSLVTATQSGKTATLNVASGALKKVGDYVTVTYTVKNTSKDLIANLGTLTVTPGSNNNYVKFEASYGTGGQELAATTGTTTVIVTATLQKAPADANITAKATISFTATAEET